MPPLQSLWLNHGKLKVQGGASFVLSLVIIQVQFMADEQGQTSNGHHWEEKTKFSLSLINLNYCWSFCQVYDYWPHDDLSACSQLRKTVHFCTLQRRSNGVWKTTPRNLTPLAKKSDLFGNDTECPMWTLTHRSPTHTSYIMAHNAHGMVDNTWSRFSLRKCIIEALVSIIRHTCP